MATTFIYLPPEGGDASLYWQDAVATTGDLPAVDNTVGEVRLVQADHSLRYWDGAAWQVLIAGPSGTYVLKSGDTMSGDLTISTLTASKALTTNGSKQLTSSTTTDTELGYVSGVTSAIQTQINSKQATITGGATSITSANLTASRALASDLSGKVAVATTTSAELDFVSGVTSAIQTQLNAKQATITGAATTIATSNLTTSRAVVSDGSGKVAVATTTATEIGYVNGVTSAIQTQIDAKQATITGAATTIASSNLTTSRAVVSDGSGKVAVATTTATEIGYVNGVTSAIQTQINGKQATGNYITALTGDVTASGPGSVAGTVASVGGKTAAAVATSVDDTIAATSSNTNSTIVKRDSSGNFAANIGTFTSGVKVKNTGAGSDTLSWYEEAAFTPTLITTGTQGTPTYGVQVGAYTRIGRLVFYQAYVQWTNWTGSPTGGLRVGGLPYLSSITSNTYGMSSCNTDNVVWPASTTQIAGQVNPAATSVGFVCTLTSAGSSTLLASSNAGSATRGIFVTGFYYV